ncbi:MAG TPA: hypothetical protein VK603_16135 [Candidatus Saccharimonadales bacterium]|nr:hypothetical protein [Candidatus Saccharimonadales bacterium]
MTVIIDFKNEDGKPHWLSKAGNPRPTKDDIRKKHRDKYLAEQKAKRNGDKADG